MTKIQANQIHALIYSICYDISHKTPIVNKVLRQIRLGLKKLSKEDYSYISSTTHSAWETARKSMIDKDQILEVQMSELLMSLYNSMNNSKYQNMHVSDKNFTRFFNSFESCLTNRLDDGAAHYAIGGRALAKVFKSEIGIKEESPLSRMKYTISQNKIIEGK